MSSSISVAVRVRPFSEREHNQLTSNNYVGPALFLSDPNATHATPQPPKQFSSSAISHSATGAIRKVLKVVDDRILVFDPPESNPVSAFQKVSIPSIGAGKKVKDIRFCFDRVFDEECGQEEVYNGSAKELVGHVMDGFHSTVFAYGATGCGKTHTISGSESQPGIVFLIMKDLFSRISDKSEEIDFSLSISYLEIYNENIRDLLAPENGALPLRESNGVATPAGLSTKEPTSAADVVEWITLGNTNRTVNATEANSTSSRSHAVLRVTVTQKPKSGGMKDEQSTASLSVIDLAGSERASVTKNKGERLNEGANINRSLLALGNCINALCDPRKRGHVPYRDSKLTRLLKQSLGGNCKTVMIVCVSPSSAHYDETHNTLQYANRAKEIKTKAIRNFVSVDRHVGQYCAQIQEQAITIERLKNQLSLQKSITVTSSGSDREEDIRAVKLAVMKLNSTWENSCSRLFSSEKATIERNQIESMLQLLRQWSLTTFSTSSDHSSTSSSPSESSSSSLSASLPNQLVNDIISTLRISSDELIRSFCNSSALLREEISKSENVKTSYSVLSNNIARTLSTEKPTATPLFELELKAFELRLNAALAEAKWEGEREGLKIQARMMEIMYESRGIIANALNNLNSEEPSSTVELLQKLAEKVDKANKEIFSTLLNTSTSSNSSSSFLSSSTSMKRGMGTRSPMEPSNVWSDTIPRKAARGTLNGLGSTPNGHYYPSPQRQRQSPRKGVSYVRSSPKKKKGVQWREEGEGEGKLTELRTFEEVGPSPPTLSLPLLSSNYSPVTTSSFPPPQPTPKVSLWTATSNLSNIVGSTSAAADMSALVAKQRASATKSLRNKATSSSSSSKLHHSLSSLIEEDSSKPFTFDLPHSNSRTSISSSSNRVPFSDVGNSSITSDTSSNSTPTGFFPLKSNSSSSKFTSSSSSTFKRPSSSTIHHDLSSLNNGNTPKRLASKVRRTSTLGPQRSIKSNRRTSYIAPTSNNITSTSSSTTNTNNFTKSRNIGNNFIPGSIRKSPRKVASTSTHSNSTGNSRIRSGLGMKSGGPSFLAPTTSSLNLGLSIGSAFPTSGSRRESSLAGLGGLSLGPTGRRSGSGGRESLNPVSKGSWR